MFGFLMKKHHSMVEMIKMKYVIIGMVVWSGYGRYVFQSDIPAFGVWCLFIASLMLKQPYLGCQA
jgi:hypothetical protein